MGAIDGTYDIIEELTWEMSPFVLNYVPERRRWCLTMESLSLSFKRRKIQYSNIKKNGTLDRNYDITKVSSYEKFFFFFLNHVPSGHRGSWISTVFANILIYYGFGGKILGCCFLCSFDFTVVFLQDRLLFKGRKSSLALYLSHSWLWLKKRWIHIFPEVITAKVNLLTIYIQLLPYCHLLL